MKRIVFLTLIVFGFQAPAQTDAFSRRDSLQGGLRPERTCFDVLRYDLDIRINIPYEQITGHNAIRFKIADATKRIQLDLFENMKVDSIVYQSRKLEYEREFGAVFISFPEELKPGTEHQLFFYYSGQPKQAPRAPWQGGFVWNRVDEKGKDFVGVAVQGTGASLWYPVKDSQSDEPDQGASIHVAVRDGLTAVSNGRFKGSEKLGDGYTKWKWEVVNPINNYDITVNIGDYVHISDKHKGLDLDYYVLSYNEKTAREHFKEVKTMLDCFQEKFGTYPFAEDGFKLVDTPYLGMEHQSAIAYGNEYMKGYKGNDLSGTGIGLKFDYIIIHESGHEWFGNSITSRDIADMWIHEGFTMYSEAVYVECTQGKEKAYQYMRGIRKNIHNYDPVIGQFGVNNEGSGDMYPKGAWLIHTIRNAMDNDDRFWKILKRFCERYRHQIIDTKIVCDYFSRETNLMLRPVFEQYLNTTKIPALTWEKEGGKWSYRWDNTVRGFSLPVRITVGGKSKTIQPTAEKQYLSSTDKPTVLAEDLLINVKGL